MIQNLHCPPLFDSPLEYLLTVNITMVLVSVLCIIWKLWKNLISLFSSILYKYNNFYSNLYLVIRWFVFCFWVVPHIFLFLHFKDIQSHSNFTIHNKNSIDQSIFRLLRSPRSGTNQSTSTCQHCCMFYSQSNYDMIDLLTCIGSGACSFSSADIFVCLISGCWLHRSDPVSPVKGSSFFLSCSSR